MNRKGLIKLGAEKKLLGPSRRPPETVLLADLFEVMQAALNRASDDGYLWSREAIWEFGRRRGSRITERIIADGKLLTLHNFLAYSDITSRGYKMNVALLPNGMRAEIRCCPFRGAIGKAADCYCRIIDRAVLEGAQEHLKPENRKIELRHQAMHVSPDGICRLTYTES